MSVYVCGGGIMLFLLPCVFLLFLFLWQNTLPKSNIGEFRDYFHLHLNITVILRELKAGTRRQAYLLFHKILSLTRELTHKEIEQGPWRMLLAGWFPGSHSAGFLTAQDHLPRDGVTHSGLGLLTPTNQTIPHRHTHRSIWSIEAFFSVDFKVVSGWQRMCVCVCVFRKLTRTKGCVV